MVIIIMTIWARLVWTFTLALLAPVRFVFAVIPLGEMRMASQDLERGLDNFRKWLKLHSV
jgi:hypothetical protein